MHEQKRPVLWIMDEHQSTAQQEIENLNLGLTP